MPNILIRVTSDRAPPFGPFVAGFLYDGLLDRCTSAAPILRRALLGKGQAEIRSICERRGWRAAHVKATHPV